MKSERQAAEILADAREAGYESIEMCGYLTRRMPLLIRGFAAMAGMPIGPCGKLDWRRIVRDSGMSVVSVHEDLGTIEKKPDLVAEETAAFGTDTVVVTGMYKFDYSDADAVLRLADALSNAGRSLSERGLRLLYHNHNCELARAGNARAFDLIVDRTDPKYVGFEYDPYWMAEAGADPLEWMERLGGRMRMWHVNDRGFRPAGKTASIRKSGGMEPGYGNMPLVRIAEKAAALGAEAAVLENHASRSDIDPVWSVMLSAAFMNRYVGGASGENAL